MPDHSSPPKSRQEKAVSILLWFCIAFMLVLPCFFVVHGMKDALAQRRINRDYVQVQATVLSSDVSSWEGEHNVKHYDANVRYQYEAGGKTYQGDRLMALIAYGSEDWANRVVSRYKKGQTCDVFYDPASPDKSVLMRAYQFDPYAELLQAAFMLSCGFFFVTYLWFGQKPHLLPAENGWFSLRPESGERQRLFAAKVCAAVWYLFGTIPTAHYFLCVPPPHSHRALSDFTLFYVLGLIPVAMLIRYWWMCRNMDEAQLLVDGAEGVLGKRLRFSLSQMTRRQLQLKQAGVQLVCVGVKRQGKSSTSTTLFESETVELKSRTLHTGESLELSGEWMLPSNQPPTGRDASGKYDWIGWKIIFDSDLVHAPDYVVEYRFDVKAPPVEMPEPAVKPGVFADVRAVEPEHAGRILSKRNLALAYLVTFIPMGFLAVGIGLMFSVQPIVFPSKNDMNPLWNLPKPQALRMFEIGAVVAVISSVWGIGFSGRLPRSLLFAMAKREIKRRRDAIVQPDAGSVFVDIIPRSNWNRMMLENAADAGFLAVDAARREIRFEGDKERYRIPADALLSCEVEKSVYSQAAKPTAPGFFLVVLRASTPSGFSEMPVAPRIANSIFNSNARQQAALALQAKIMALKPANIVVTSHRHSKSSPQDA